MRNCLTHISHAPQQLGRRRSSFWTFHTQVTHQKLRLHIFALSDKRGMLNAWPGVWRLPGKGSKSGVLCDFNYGVLNKRNVFKIVLKMRENNTNIQHHWIYSGGLMSFAINGLIAGALISEKGKGFHANKTSVTARIATYISICEGDANRCMLTSRTGRLKYGNWAGIGCNMQETPIQITYFHVCSSEIKTPNAHYTVLCPVIKCPSNGIAQTISVASVLFPLSVSYIDATWINAQSSVSLERLP